MATRKKNLSGNLNAKKKPNCNIVRVRRIHEAYERVNIKIINLINANSTSFYCLEVIKIIYGSMSSKPFAPPLLLERFAVS